MIEELLISATPFGVRAAALAAREVLAFNAESHVRPSLLGNIYSAAPGRRGGAARFVVIAEDQSAFLPEIVEKSLPSPVVQVIREAWGGKAPRVSAEPALAGRYLVYFPHGRSARVARRIDDEAERARLRALGRDIVTEGGGVTLRGAADGAAVEVIRAEAARLRRRWLDIEAKRATVAAPALLAAGPSLPERLMRDIPPGGIARIFLDDKIMHGRLSAYSEETAPELAARLNLVDDALFERHDAAGALAAALRPEVALPGGGRLTIEPTRALTAIDVDSGARAGGRESALGTARSEAAAVAAREIRRRNLAGLIVIDFPRPAGADAREALLAKMRAHMKADPTPHNVAGMSASGLMEITRRRAETPILEALTEAAPGGGHGGRRRRLDALAFDVADQARTQVRAGARRVTLRMAPELTDFMARFSAKAGANGYPALDEWLGAGVAVREEPARRREEWAIEAE